MELQEELNKQVELLQKSLEKLKETGKAYAEAERKYKVILRQECLRLRDEGMAIGMIDKTCYGIPKVADARFERDCAEAVYKANQEAINTYKLKIRLLESQIGREWSNEMVR